MQITDKLLKQIPETKYLTVENTDRYRVILRYFYLCYEKLKYWLYQEDVYAQLTQHEYFKEYTVEQCQQDLTNLTLWKNLVTIQDTRKVSTIEEFKNKKFRYQLSEYSVEIERLVIKLENLFVEGASLEPTLLERMRNNLLKAEEVLSYDRNQTYSWWNDLNNDFIRLNQNYQDYIRELNSIKAEEMMKTKEFLVFKDRLVEYLRTFVKSLQKNVSIIEGCLIAITEEKKNIILGRVVAYELSIPRMEVEVNEKMLLEKNQGRFESLCEWFVGIDGKENEAGKLFDATNEIIRKMTRYATQISEQSGTGANRKEEYAKVAEMFLKTKDKREAHRLSALVFGIDKPIHLKGEFTRQTDSMNSGVYDEKAKEIVITPRIRNYREKAKRSAIRDCSKEKEALRTEMLFKIEENRKLVNNLIKENAIDFGSLPTLVPQVRETLLVWISNALETKGKNAKTEDGYEYHLDLSRAKEFCKVVCSDGILTMPHIRILFDTMGE